MSNHAYTRALVSGAYDVDLKNLSSAAAAALPGKVFVLRAGRGAGSPGAAESLLFSFDVALTAGEITTLDATVVNHKATLDVFEVLRERIQSQVKEDLLADPLKGLVVTSVASGLTITTSIESLVDNDQTLIVADLVDTKFVSVRYVYNSATDTFSLEVFEKTTGEYATLLPPEYLVRDLKEFSVVANGTVLVEV